MKKWYSVAILALILAASGCSSAQAGDSASGDWAAEQRFLNEEANAGLYQRLSITETFEQFTSTVDVVFVGRLTGAKLEVAMDGPDSDDPRQGVIVHDGLVFEVISVLHGDDVGDEVVIAHPVGLTQRGEPSLTPIRAAPTATFETALRSRGADNGKGGDLFIVAAQLQTFTSGDAYIFYSDAAAAPVRRNGTILNQDSGPFMNTSADRSRSGRDVTTSDFADWLRTGPPEIEIPKSAWPTAEDAPEVLPGREGLDELNDELEAVAEEDD